MQATGITKTLVLITLPNHLLLTYRCKHLVLNKKFTFVIKLLQYDVITKLLVKGYILATYTIIMLLQ